MEERFPIHYLKKLSLSILSIFIPSRVIRLTDSRVWSVGALFRVSLQHNWGQSLQSYCGIAYSNRPSHQGNTWIALRQAARLRILRPEPRDTDCVIHGLGIDDSRVSKIATQCLRPTEEINKQLENWGETIRSSIGDYRCSWRTNELI